MKLKDLYNTWVKFEGNDLIIIDRKREKTYYDFYKAIKVWYREVDSFYIEDNNLYIRIK